MTTAASTPPAPADKTQLSKSAENTEKVTKVDKPDEEKYKRDVSEADKQLSALQEKMTALRVKIDGSSGKGPNSARLAELRSQIDSIKEKQAALKSGKSGIQQQLDALKIKIEREQNELKAKRGKLNYRSTDEIDREIKTLEGEVDSGKLKLVDEKKNLKRITDLRSLRKQMSIFTVAEESIKSDISKRKALQEELSSTTQTPEAKALSEEFNRIREEMTKLKGENDEMFAKRGELKTQRDELQKSRDKAYEHKKMVQDEYFKQRDAFRAWNEHNRKAQSERYWKQREEEERGRIEHNASIRLEEASQDAFASEIWKCENLLRLFGGSEGVFTAEPKSPTAAVPAAPVARTVETTGLTKLTSKKDREADDFLFGASSKKKQPKPKPTNPKTTGKPKGLVLSMDVMKTLGELEVVLPTSDENIKTTVEELKTKLTYFKENQARFTQENISKAKKSNEDVERKQMAAFFEKKEADLSGRKNRGNGGKKPSTTDRKSGKEKVNGNHSETKADGAVENGEKETTPDTE